MVDYPAGVKVVVIRPNGDMLILRRSGTHPTRPHWVDLPGGLIEKGEPEVSAAVRELKEETSIEAKQAELELFFADSFLHPFSKKSYTVLYYKVQLKKDPVIKLSFEHESHEWHSPRDFLKIEQLEIIQRKAIEYGLSQQLL